jgi:drug/metabolite transporter (DMT)-like permease
MRNETLAGIGYMMFGIVCFAAMDAAGKWVVRDISVFQLLALRSGLVAALLLSAAPFLGWRRAFHTTQPRAHLFRSLCSTLAFLFFFASVRFLPLADAVAIAFGGPFIVTALSVPILAEHVDRARWIAVATGFLGMLLIVQPTGEAFRPAALLVIASSFSYALVMVLTRWMSRRSDRTERTYTFLVYTFVFQALVGFTFGLSRWKAMSGFELLLTGAVGLLALGGHFGITVAFQHAPASVVAPFEYTALVWATLFGFFVFGDFPALSVWLGVAVIVSSGLYTLHREGHEKPSDLVVQPVLDEPAGDRDR